MLLSRPAAAAIAAAPLAACASWTLLLISYPPRWTLALHRAAPPFNRLVARTPRAHHRASRRHGQINMPWASSHHNKREQHVRARPASTATTSCAPLPPSRCQPPRAAARLVGGQLDGLARALARVVALHFDRDGAGGLADGVRAPLRARLEAAQVRPLVARAGRATASATRAHNVREDRE